MADRTWLVAGVAIVVYGALFAVAAWMSVLVVGCQMALPVGPSPLGLPCAGVWWPHPAVPRIGLGVTVVASVAVVVAAGRAVYEQTWGTRAKIRALLTTSVEPSPRLAAAATDIGLESVTVVAHDEAFAFCHGLRRPQVVVSTAMVRLLDDPALRAVLAHEAHHVATRDPLRIAMLRTIAAVAALFPVLRDLATREAARREVAADRWAESQVGRRPLIEALTAVLSCPRMSLAIDVPGFDSLDVRVAAITGQDETSPPRRLRTPRLVVTALVVAVLVTLAATAGWATYRFVTAPVVEAEVIPVSPSFYSPDQPHQRDE